MFFLLPSFAVCFTPSPEALRLVVEAAKPGASVLSLCEKGDLYIMAETGKVFKKEKEMKKGEARMVTSAHLLCFWGWTNQKEPDKSYNFLLVFVCKSTGVFKCSNMVAEDDKCIFIM